MINELVDEILDWTSQRMANPGKVWGLPWGFAKLDELTGGIHEGQMSVIGGRTGAGKSVLAMTTAMAVARHLIQHDLPGQVLIYSPEMRARSLMMRYLQQRTGIPSDRVNRGELTPDEVEIWEGACEKLRAYEGRVVVEAQSDLHIQDLIADIEARALEDPNNPVRLVVVDYIQYVNGNGGNRYEQVTDVAQRLKLLNNRTGIPILAVAQIHKAAKDRNGKRQEDDPPTMDDISDSQYIARVADNVIVLWRPEHKFGGRKARIELAKARDGATGSFWLAYDPETTRFYDE